MIAPGPHALVVVLRIDMKFTDEEAKAIDHVKEMFGEQLPRYLVIVFTHGELLSKSTDTENAESESFKKLLDESPDSLKKFVKVRYMISKMQLY